VVAYGIGDAGTGMAPALIGFLFICVLYQIRRAAPWPGGA